MRKRDRHRSAAAPQASLTLAAFLPYRLNVLAAVVSDGLARIYGERFGVGIPEWRVIATLGEFRSMTAKAIGAHARMNKVGVSRAVAALESRGLVARTPNEQDRRETFLELTRSGKDVYEAVVPLALAYEGSLLGNLPADQRAAFDSVLATLLQRAECVGSGNGERRDGSRDHGLGRPPKLGRRPAPHGRGTE